jgi:LacI family transcriptional regulator
MVRQTIREVAERASVSLGTVSNVLNKPELVAEETRERVLAAIDELGFVRNHAARQLRGVKSKAIALIVLDFDNPFFTEVARGVEHAAAQADHLVILASSGTAASREDQALRLLEEQRVAGILVSPATSSPRHRGYARSDAAARRSFCSTGHRRRRDQCSVASTTRAEAARVGEHLVALGHKRIGLINGLRAQAVRRTPRRVVRGPPANGVEVAARHRLEMDEMTTEAGERAMSELLSRRPPPSAVSAATTSWPSAQSARLLAHGLAIPGDVAIVGYDDIRFAATPLVPLTSVPTTRPTTSATRQRRLLIEEATDSAHRSTGTCSSNRSSSLAPRTEALRRLTRALETYQ